MVRQCHCQWGHRWVLVRVWSIEGQKVASAARVGSGMMFRF